VSIEKEEADLAEEKVRSEKREKESRRKGER